MQPIERAALRKLRASLLSQAVGKTLEIGVGTGLNLAHYPKGVELTGIDPDEHMLSRARRRLERQQTVPTTLVQASAEQLPFSDAEFDTVVGTLVFCSIPAPERALREVYRVLKPGGKLLLLEHVRRHTAVIGGIQDMATPVWKHLAGGCHLNRDPEAWLKDAGLRSERMESLWSGLGKIMVLRKTD